MCVCVCVQYWYIVDDNHNSLIPNGEELQNLRLNPGPGLSSLPYNEQRGKKFNFFKGLFQV